MANHRGSDANAYYSLDENGDVVLLPLEAEGVPKNYRIGHDNNPKKNSIEVRINYGFDKSSAELLFSYGFISSSKVLTPSPSITCSCLWLTLSLECLSDDPLKLAKEAVLTAAPTVRIYDLGHNGQIEWTSEFVWLICANAEDGLEFRIVKDVEGNRSLEMVWVPPPLSPAVTASRGGKEGDGRKEYPITNLASLQAYMQRSSLYPVYQLRAIVTISNRVEQQLARLEKSIEEDEESEREGIKKEVFDVVQDLKQREKSLLEKTLVFLEKEKERLVDDDIVRAYLERASDCEAENDVDTAPRDFKAEEREEDDGENEESEEDLS